jgi:uncharacterized protein
MDTVLTNADSPFHEGEQEIHARLGIRDKMEASGRRVIRDHMPDQHRQFYTMLPFLLIGTVDELGRPWASMVVDRPGFITTPDDRTLDIAAQPLFGDPLATSLRPGADIGILGIQPENRRRNRMSGRVASVGANGFSIAVVQAFGNCPQYIQTRHVEVLPGIDSPERQRRFQSSERFDAATRDLIERSDTLFIATSYSDGRNTSSRGADVSHRGGRPGFVRVEDDRTFVFPDFAGNYYFNTVGNLVLNPKAGFLFIDFDTGDLVYLSGETEIVWDGEKLRAFAGAERIIRFRVNQLIRVEASLPLRFTFGEYSPMLKHTGSWEQSDATIAANKERSVYTPYEIFDIRRESDVISSFYLRRADGKGLASYEPGQFLPIRLAIPGRTNPVLRTYTLSDAPTTAFYRLTITREDGEASVSNYFHHAVRVGDRIEAMAPRGKFVLDRSSNRPVVLVSAGVGVTPMIAIANAVINEGLRTRRFRRTYFIHGARNGRVHAFADHIRRLAAEHESFTAHIRYSDPTADDRLGQTHDSEGHVDVALLKQTLPFDDYDFYLCGPAAFMRSLYEGLTALGVRDERIRYESFGPATVLKSDAGPRGTPSAVPSAKRPVDVRLAASGVDFTWTPDKGTLLDLAEAAGLSPAYACRSGICGTCATRIKCGAVDYLDEPSAPVADDEVLICCSTPRFGSGEETCGERSGIVLDL